MPRGGWLRGIRFSGVSQVGATSGRCDDGCHRLSERRVTRAFARITAGFELA